MSSYFTNHLALCVQNWYQISARPGVGERRSSTEDPVRPPFVINNQAHLLIVRARGPYSSRSSWVGARRYLQCWSACPGILGRWRAASLSRRKATNNNSFPSTIASWEEWGKEVGDSGGGGGSASISQEVACAGCRAVTAPTTNISKIQRNRWCIAVSYGRAVAPLVKQRLRTGSRQPLAALICRKIMCIKSVNTRHKVILLNVLLCSVGV